MKNLNWLLMMMLGISMGIAEASFNPNIFRAKAVAPSSQVVQAAPETAQTQSVDINSANVEQLTSLKGIGTKKAEAIVAYRQQHGNFKSVNDLAEVKGFSEKQLAVLLKNNENRIKVTT